ncbi:unnamed protein product, partial [Coregonus sp. 'balchen']
MILTLCALVKTNPANVLMSGTPTGIVLRDDPGLLITNCRVHKQRVYVRLDAENVYRQHISPAAHMSWAGADWTTQAVKHTQMLAQLQKFTVTQLKTVLNVGFWRNDTHVKIITSPVVAYQEHNPDFYLTTNLLMCTLTKDVHYLCPSKPFIRDNTEHLCGLKPITSEKQVPEGAIIHIDDVALYQLPDDRLDTDIEMPDVFAKHSLELPPAIQNQIQYQGPMTVDL